ncbi:lytic murein transglycosylase [Roseobacter weihaiensis]|uniref:lytic murein transglycosylase n=1 Tax=Roseobacter weihaiensis TaxID=2763262 RepID=UPI001D0A9519|nr:lytic murein transglycosylase [Roseobacter sp. H9]
MKRMIFGASFLGVVFGAQTTVAQSLGQSLRPVVRPAVVAPVNVIDVSATVTAIDRAVRPKTRPSTLAGQAEQAMQVATSAAGFDRWVGEFRSRAERQGIRSATLDAAFRGVSFDADVIRRDRNQSEFTKTIWQYLSSAASDTRIANGKAALARHRATLEAIERRYGVEKEVVVAVWGLESAYGSYRGSNDIVRSLATLAYEGRRGAFFEEQLFAALKILQSGDTSPRNMTGSWAGAMGHTQFIPTSYLAYAVDFNGDGRRDIWSEDPTDALASTAAYLKRYGWTKGQPWGVEVQLPRGFDYTQANRTIKKSPNAWARDGIMDMNGRKVPNHGRASILLPAGAQGAAFMIFDNFAAIEAYNTADAYVIGVGHLSDRIKGGSPIRASWPTGDRALSFAERQELQRRLTQAGFSTQGIDGRIGPKTIDAIRSFQRNRGLVPDGYASLALLQRLR